MPRRVNAVISLYTVLILFAFIHLPAPAFSATMRDVQNFLRNNPPPKGCSYRTEEIATNAGKIVKVWTKCYPNRARVRYYYLDYKSTGGGYGAGRVEYLKCDYTGDTAWFNGGYFCCPGIYVKQVYCDGTESEPGFITQAGYVNASADPCYYAKVYYPDGSCEPTETLLAEFVIDSCDLKVTGLSGSSATIDPDAGGSATISGSISDSSGKPITWALSYPGGSASDSGSSASTTWDGKIGGRYAEPRSYTATLSAQNTAGCSDSKSVTIKVERTDDCKLKITIGSSANVASGNLSHSQELFSSKGAGLTTSVTLYYNSFDPYSGPLGIGWTHNYDIAVKENSDGSVVLRQGDGGRKLYIKSGTGYVSQPGDYSTLTKNAGGAFVITQKDGTKYNFINQSGKISSIVDRNGNAMTMSYTNSNLTTIIDPAGRTTAISYDGANHITSIIDPSGNAYSFNVSNNILSGATYPNSGQWSYTYDSKAFMLTKTDPENHTVTYTYDQNHRVLTSTDSEGKTRIMTYPAGTDTIKTTTFTETDGGTWQYTNDTRAGTLTKNTAPNGNSTSYTYDRNRNMLSKTDPDGTSTTYTYDASGNMTSNTDALGQTTSYTYNVFGQVASITDPQGN